MITRVAIKNFKAFVDAEINMTSLNLFTGLNGMGKSTFIQALLLLRQSEFDISPNYNGLKLKGDLVDIGKGQDAYSVNAEGDFIGFEIDEEYEPLLKAYYTYEAQNDTLDYAETNHDCFHQEGLWNTALFHNSRFRYLKADRISPEHIYKANVSEVIKSRHLGFNGENTAFFIAYNKLKPVLIETCIHPEATSNTLISNIDAWMNDITPGVHVLATYYNELDVVRLGFQFDTMDDTTPSFSAKNVGFGFTYTLPIITCLLSSQPGDLIIIENPESHLHPRGQSKLGELIARTSKGGVQIIIESHSDHLFNGMRNCIKREIISPDDFSVFYFERDMERHEHVTTIDQPVVFSDGRISHRPKGFFDEYSNQLDFLLE